MHWNRNTPEKFWLHVDRSNGPDSCWLWTAGTNSRDYGLIRFNGRQRLAHRVAYELTHGPIADSVKVCHTCDTPRCCNPAHHFLGTQRDNALDMWEKGRGASGDRSGSRTMPERRPRGSQNPRAKITEADVPAIRARFADGTTVATLAREYDVHWRTMFMLVQRKTWRHVG